ncbi:MAG: 2-amino-4-hydroxy-6-hydroxymethyldihydropteridine diphosphokinase [Caenibius sp.]
MNRYLVALGSNVRHPRFGRPRDVVRAAFAALGSRECAVVATSRIVNSAPLGPSRRRYANGAAIVKSTLGPDAMLDFLQAIEARFGRRHGRGQVWSARVLDLDIVLWSGGVWASERLIIPHSRFRERGFVLVPALDVAADWRDPISGLRVRHLHAGLTSPRTLPR